MLKVLKGYNIGIIIIIIEEWSEWEVVSMEVVI